LTPDAAEDAVQAFYAHIFERPFIERLDREKGKLRSYLRQSLDHFLSHRREFENAARRGGGARVISIDREFAERELAQKGGDASKSCEREWAATIMARALDRLRGEYESGARRGSFAALAKFFGGAEAPDYGAEAAAAGMTKAEFKAFLFRARARFRELVRRE